MHEHALPRYESRDLAWYKKAQEQAVGWTLKLLSYRWKV